MVTASISVTNTGDISGDHSVLLFAKPPLEVVAEREHNGAPLRNLVRFGRLANIQPGETRVLVLELTAHHFAFADQSGRMKSVQGMWRLQVGGGGKVTDAEASEQAVSVQ